MTQHDRAIVARLPERAPRIGIVMMSAVGDAVHVLPLLTALKAHRPDAHVTWVLQPGAATLVRGHGAVDEIVEFDRSRGWRAYPAVRRALGHPPVEKVLALEV
jgi:heptosyltransferase I